MDEVIDGFDMVYMAHYRGEPSDHVTERDDGYVKGSSGRLICSSMKNVIHQS